MRAAAFCLLRVNTNSSDSFNSQQPHCAVSPSDPEKQKEKKKNIYLAAITVTVPHTGTMCSNYMHT